MKVENIEKFENFLRKNAKNYNKNVDGYLAELDRQYGETGLATYELSKFETNSKTTECIRYEVIYAENNNDFIVKF